MLSLEEARDRILVEMEPSQAERIELAQVVGRVLAEPIEAPIDLPPFNNSAMDGYAVRASETMGASTAQPVRLRLVGREPAGEVHVKPMQSGECIRLFTGSGLPPGADAVIMQEDTVIDGAAPDEVLITDAVEPRENVRFQGEDIKRGVRQLESGHFLGVGDLALLGALGLESVLVHRQPLVGVLSTGTELAVPGQPLAPGQIYESNRLMVAKLVETAGALPMIHPLIPDQLEATEQAMRGAMEACDAVVTSGGVSVGELDLLKEAFQRMGGEVHFWRVAMRPGKPFVFGRWRGRYWFGLPGNPVSALVTFLLLVWPALRRWQGSRATELPSVTGTLTERINNPGDRRHFVRVHLRENGEVGLSGPQGSHMIGSLARANGLVDVPPATTLEVGSRIEVSLLPVH